MGQTVRFQEMLRRLATIDEGFVEDQAGLGLGLAGISALDPKTAALLQIAVSVALGSPPVCLQWSAGRALAAGANEDEIAEVLLAIAPVAGLGRVAAADPEVATALGHDVAVAPEDRMTTDGSSAGHIGLSTEPAEEHSRRLRMNGPRGRPASNAASGSVQQGRKEAGMATRDQPGDGWTVVLRRQPARMVEGRPEGGYTDAFEIICCDRSDHPDLDYSQVSPELQRVRGPYPPADGISAYVKHAGLHQPARATGMARSRMLADRR